MKEMAKFLISVLNTPVKLELLRDLRYDYRTTVSNSSFSNLMHRTSSLRPVLYPEDLAVFDKHVSHHELAAMMKKNGVEDKPWKGKATAHAINS